MTPNLAPFLLLLSVFLPSAAATELPTWEAKEEAWGNWVNVYFADEKGGPQFLWCRQSECGRERKSGAAQLFVFIKDKEEPKGRNGATLTYFRTELSPYVLTRKNMGSLMGAGEVTKIGASFSAVARYSYKSLATQASMSTLGNTIKVLPPAETPVVAPVASIVTLLTAQELLWLSRVEKRAYEAVKTPAESAAGGKEAALRRSILKGIVDALRAKIKANLRPEALPNYEKALNVTKTAAAIDASLISVKMWGEKKGAVTAIVEFSGDNVEIQLSAADFKTLSEKKPDDAIKAYKLAHGAANGRGGEGDTAFHMETYDPIALHQAAEAARKALGGTTAPAPGGAPAPGAPAALLTDDEKKLLTPEEFRNYRSILGSAKGNAADENLQKLTKALRAKIESEGRKNQPYTEPTDLAAFNKLVNWHKDIFCDLEKAGAAGAAATPDKSDFDPKSGTLSDLQRLEAEKIVAAQKAVAEAGKPFPAWARGPCAKYLAGKKPPPTPDGKPSIAPPVGGTGSGTEKEVPKPNPWLARPLIYSAVKGALVGALVGSLFGPGGVILGALIGAGIFYGVSKWTE